MLGAPAPSGNKESAFLRDKKLPRIPHPFGTDIRGSQPLHLLPYALYIGIITSETNSSGSLVVQ
jgi:hypothetical protein